MATFNTIAPPLPPTSYVKSRAKPTGTNDLGGDSYRRTLRSELWLLSLAMLDVEQDTWHETGNARVDRYRELVRDLAVCDGQWLAGEIGYLRGTMNMRSAGIVAAAEFVHSRCEAGLHGLSRQVVDVALQRADEPGELLAYWTARYGRRLPKPLKRGIADAVRRLYTERALLKWDSPARAWRFGDVISMVHPKPRGEQLEGDPTSQWQAAVFAHAINRRHGRDEELPPGVPVLRYRRTLMSLPPAQRRQWLLDAAAEGTVAEQLRAAGMTWESVAGWLQGPMDAAAWEAVIPAMGYIACLRNLRNFDDAGVSDTVATQVAHYLTSPQEVAASKVFPFHYLSARKAAGWRWVTALEFGVRLSLLNVPALSGRSLVLVDRSPSMWEQKMSRKSRMDWADGAALFGAALALRAEHADLAEFGWENRLVDFRAGESIFDLVDRFGRHQGTDIPSAIRSRFRAGYHDRVVIITDEQTQPGRLPYYKRGAYGMWQREMVNVDDVMPTSVPLYMWNFGGYEGGAVPTGTGNRHTFGGLTDEAFKAISLIEGGTAAQWPW